MYKKKLLIIFFVFLAGSVIAQSDFRPGYIITSSGDSISGEIDYRGDLSMGNICRFRSDSSSEEKEYSPHELAAFRFAKSKYYVSREINITGFEGKAFLEFLVNGKMDVFYYRSEKGDHFFVEKEGFDLVELPYEKTIKYKGGKPHYYESTKHKGILKNLMADAPQLYPRIEKLKKPSQETLITLAREYHNAASEEGGYEMYEQEPKMLSVSIEPLFGYTKYQDANILIREAGGHIFFWLPRKNEKLYLKTGYFLQQFTANKKRYRVNKVPIQIQYLYPKEKFQPKLNFGVDYYLVFINDYWISRFYTLHLGTGFQYQLHKKIYLSTNLSTEFEPLFFKAVETPMG